MNEFLYKNLTKQTIYLTCMYDFFFYIFPTRQGCVMRFSEHEKEGEGQMSISLCVISCSVPDGLVMDDSAD